MHQVDHGLPLHSGPAMLSERSPTEEAVNASVRRASDSRIDWQPFQSVA